MAPIWLVVLGSAIVVASAVGCIIINWQTYTAKRLRAKVRKQAEQ